MKNSWKKAGHIVKDCLLSLEGDTTINTNLNIRQHTQLVRRQWEGIETEDCALWNFNLHAMHTEEKPQLLDCHCCHPLTWKWQSLTEHLYYLIIIAVSWTYHSNIDKIRQHQNIICKRSTWTFKVPMSVSGPCKPQQRVWDFCLSLSELLELWRALNFPSRASHL